MPGAAKVALVLAIDAALVAVAAVLAALAGVGANMARGECLHCGRIAEPNFLANLFLLVLVAAPSLYFLYRNQPNLALRRARRQWLWRVSRLCSCATPSSGCFGDGEK